MSKFDKHLAHIITSLKSTYGTDFFNNLTPQLH
jgi:hypothetical protein